MIKVKSYIIVFGFLLLLSGCTNHSTANSNVANNINEQEDISEIKTIPFEYFFRGFITLKDDQIELYPRESYIIETDEDWHDFMDKYVPGIPYDLSVDYSKECLVFNVLYPAKPTYSIGVDIKTFIIDGNKLEPEYINGKNVIYAQNIDSIEHCFVNIVKISKKYMPKNASNIYHKGDILNN